MSPSPKLQAGINLNIKANFRAIGLVVVEINLNSKMIIDSIPPDTKLKKYHPACEFP